MTLLNEQDLENYCMEYFRQIGYQTVFGPDILPEGANPLRGGCSPSYFAAKRQKRACLLKSGRAASGTGRGIPTASQSVRSHVNRPQRNHLSLPNRRH